MKRKLIEVSLPLEAINKQAAREKSIRHGHPATLHLWWARRPLAAARAVLFAQLVDDPSARPEEFPTETDQRRERERLHNLIERLVDWDNIGDEKLFAEAHAEILKSADGVLPAILDPFAGGGTIPLEAQRLGLEARASDLNPVAVLINKALIELPSKFRDQPPLFPGLIDAEIRDWRGTEGLAADLRAYGRWMREKAAERLLEHYPPAQLSDGSSATVIAWIWARTVTCSNPACGVEMPLVRSWWLGKRTGSEAYIVPSVVEDDGHPSGRRVAFSVGNTTAEAPTSTSDGTVSRTGATCVACAAAVDLKYVRSEGASGRMGKRLMAVVAEGNRSRVYLPTDEAQEVAAQVPPASDAPVARIPDQALGFRVQAYGMTKWVDLFTDRQVLALTTLGDLVEAVRDRVRLDRGSAEYADAIATYLGFAISRLTDRNNTICTWDSGPVGSKASTGGSARTASVRNAFARQALPMTWDFAESNPFSASGGSLESALDWVVPAVERLVAGETLGFASQGDARDAVRQRAVISTDPPYYDNIGYSDLSDFFYVWLRRSLRKVHPRLLSTMLVPKDEELVANPFRHGGKNGARKFFEDGFRDVFANARVEASADYPITVYYAFKQTETDGEGQSSTGWETLLEGMIRAGWEITSTWPLRSELSNRMVASGTNALASSIVLSLRPRPDDAPTTDRRGYADLLRDELPDKLRELQHGAIAPVDLAQAAIGPGMAVFSRFSRVVEPSGAGVTVREALRLINTVLAEVLSDQEGDLDTDTRWCVKWFDTHGFDKAGYGEAETLAGAYNTSVAGLDRSGAVYARAGEVRLLTTAELAKLYRPERDEHITLWEVAMHLVKALGESGLGEAGRILNGASMRVDVEAVKDLAYLVFSIAEKRSMVQVAGMFNALVTSWPEVAAAAKAHASAAPRATEQAMLDLDEVFAD